MRRRFRIPLVLITPIIAAALLAGLVIAAYHMGQADAFDRGMAAGVEYQSWFCTNTVNTQGTEIQP